jgi:hypothetical protein
VEPQRFDLAASLLRTDGGDVQALAEALATKLATALPSHTTVRRKSSGVLSRQKRVERVEVRLGDDAFLLSLAAGGAQATRAKSVGGVIIKREELELGEWLQALDLALAEEARRSEQARQALERLLE